MLVLPHGMPRMSASTSWVTMRILRLALLDLQLEQSIGSWTRWRAVERETCQLGSAV